MGQPLISICIPAYKRIAFLSRLLESIENQTFRDFEVIIGDDSDDNSVMELTATFNAKFPIHYTKNEPSLGTPSNWNLAISKANGEWIKLMHDDDWFSEKTSLQKFVDQTTEGHKFIFSGYANFMEQTKQYIPVVFPKSFKSKILKNPLLLLANNWIGPPSVTLFHKSITEKYDERLKWRVDLEYYIRVIHQEKDFKPILAPLVNVGISESQVTNFCINIPEIEIPEAYLLLVKFGTYPLKNIIVYDAWWRIIRNTNINSVLKLESYGQKNWPTLVLTMVKFQSNFKPSYLKNGYISKCLMLVSYLKNLLQSNF